jgi:hypothetical protein
MVAARNLLKRINKKATLTVAFDVSGLLSIAAIFAAAGTCFVDAYSGELRKQRFDLPPDPFGQHFAGWVFQAGDVVEVVVVELLVDGFEDRLDLGEVTNPAGMRIDVTFDIDGDSEGVAVQPATFVTFWYVRQAMGRLEYELFEQFH